MMKSDYRHMMEQVSMGEETRAAIAARLEGQAPRRKRYPLRVLLVAACVCAALVTTAAASGWHIHIQRQLPNGAEFFYEDTGGYTSSGSTSGDSPVELREGRFYLVLGGEETDITGQFSETEYFLYRAENGDGSWEDIVIGGTAEAYGYTIYVYDANGKDLGGMGGGTYEDNLAPMPWREAYLAEHSENYEPKF